MIGQIFFGLLFVAFGVSCIRWNYKIADALRDFDSLAKIGGGDVYNGTKVLGIISVLLGFTIAFGLWQSIVNMVLGAFFGQN